MARVRAGSTEERVRGSAGPTDLSWGQEAPLWPPWSRAPRSDSELWDHDSATKQKTNEEQDEPLFRYRLKFGKSYQNKEK